MPRAISQAALVFAVLATIPARPQTATVIPKFEAASVKPCKSGDLPVGGQGRSGGDNGRIVLSPGRLVAECVTLDRLIREAWLLYADGQPWPDVGYGPRSPVSTRTLEQDIKGSPARLDADHYTIEAKADAAPSREMLRGPMMRVLLEERFRLKIHRETRSMPVYELRVAKGGFKLKAAIEGNCMTIDRDHPPPLPVAGQPFPHVCGGWGGDTVWGTTMENLCRQIAPFSDRDVVDKTGITGRFDVHFDMYNDLFPAQAGGAAGPTEATHPSDLAYLTAIQNALPRLGLMLVPARASGQVLVIDHVEKPGEN